MKHLRTALLLLIALVVGALAWINDEGEGAVAGGHSVSQPASANNQAAPTGILDAQARSRSPIRSAVSDRSARNLSLEGGPRGLAYFQELYRPFFEGEGFKGGSLNGLPWWFDDPECLALFAEQYDLVRQQLEAEFALRHERERLLGTESRGSKHLLSTLSAERASLGMVSPQSVLFEKSGLESDSALQLGNMLKMQAGKLRSESWRDSGGAWKKDPFAIPLEGHLHFVAGLEVSSLSQEQAAELSSDWGNLLVEVAQIRADAQLFHAAAYHASRRLSLLSPTEPAHLALISVEYRDSHEQEVALLDSFLASIRAELAE
jgi:hypothetical protein